MELIVIMITSMFFCLSVLLSSSSATAMHIQELPPRLHQQGQVEMHISLHQLPRKLKLRFLEEAIGSEEAQGSGSNKEKKAAPAATGEGERRMVVHGGKGTWQEWAKGTSDTSDFFTMDYSHVKRRRPIHNKSLPVGP